MLQLLLKRLFRCDSLEFFLSSLPDVLGVEFDKIAEQFPLNKGVIPIKFLGNLLFLDQGILFDLDRDAVEQVILLQTEIRQRKPLWRKLEKVEGLVVGSIVDVKPRPLEIGGDHEPASLMVDLVIEGLSMDNSPVFGVGSLSVRLRRPSCH